jgi:2-C-methyl-D-erythritol 4-phosphate cytidylyltransferase
MSSQAEPSTLAGALLLASPHLAPDLLWAPLAGRPLLAWSAAACAQTPTITVSVLLVPEDRLAAAQSLAASEGWARLQIVAGGLSLRESLAAGLDALDALDPSLAWVVIHEAARPLATPALLTEALALAQREDADVLTGEPVKETVKRLRDGLVAETLPRERIVRAQAPYVFRRSRLLAALDALPPDRDFPDVVTLALASGLSLRVSPGAPDNLRVTSAADLAVAAAIHAARPS